MNKKLLLILLAGLILVGGFTLLYAKQINKEATPSKIIPRGQDKLAETPTVAKREIPSSYYSDVITRSYSGISPEDLQVKLADVEGTIKYANQYGTQEEAPLTECLIDPNLDPCCYYQPWPDYFDDRLNCCGSYVEYFVRQDPQLNADISACGYPIYPFEVSGIYLRMNVPAPCSLLIAVAAYGYWWSPSEGTWVYLDEAGQFLVGLEIPEEERPCVHGPFLAWWQLLNSDDFTEGPDPERCGPDTTRYGWWITTYFDQAPPISGFHDGYYRSEIKGPELPYVYSITDVYGGCVVLRAEGFTRDQNECDLRDAWYHKASFGEWECREPVREDLELCIVDITGDPPETTWGSYYLVEPVDYGYAPDGIPDFNQAEPNWCGPAALSNCLWWCFAGGFPWYSISNWYGGWDPTIPPAMIAELAACMNTGPEGTDVYDMQQCILDLIEAHGFWITENTIVQPTYEDIEYQVRRSQDVILLLGFWYFDEVEEIWYRLGGHYVNVEGVNIEQFMFSFSDPFINGFCDGLTPGDSSGGVFYVHDHTQNTDPPLHYDAGNVSHDYYVIGWPSPSPGGFLFIPDYDVYDPLFYGMNFTPELEPYMAPSATPQYPVHTEIEYAVVICPAEPFVSDQLDSWNVAMVKSNYGEEGPGFVYWEYYPDYTDDLFEGTVLLGTSADDLAMGITAVGEDIGFFPYGDLVCDYEYYDDVLLEKCRTSFYHSVTGHALPLDIEMLGVGFDPGGDVYYLEPEGDVVIQKFVITNTGETQIDDLEWALFMDWDVNVPDPTNTSFGGGDSVTNTYWAYDSTEEGKVAYVTLAPTSLGKIAPGMDIGDHNSYFYEFVPGGPYDSLKFMMEMTYWSVPDKTPAHTDTFDYGYLLNSEKFSLAPGEKNLQEYFIWYDTQIPSTDYTAYRCKLYRLLRLAGFYRGDVGDFGTGVASPGLLDIADIVYLVGYTLRSGPPPLPFINQGDVNCDGEVKIDDVVFLVNYILKSKPDAPIDKNRFFDEEYEQLFKRTSLFTDPQWQNLGVGCYPYRP